MLGTAGGAPCVGLGAGWARGQLPSLSIPSLPSPPRSFSWGFRGSNPAASSLCTGVGAAESPSQTPHAPKVEGFTAGPVEEEEGVPGRKEKRLGAVGGAWWHPERVGKSARAHRRGGWAAEMPGERTLRLQHGNRIEALCVLGTHISADVYG